MSQIDSVARRYKSGAIMAISGVRHIPCGAPVNASERLAIEKLRNKLQSVSKPWLLLSNLNHSANTSRLSDEIDIVAIGLSGVFVIEVKHWDLAYLRQHPDVVESEAERISDKSKRIAGKLRKHFDVGFVEPRLLLTRCTTALQASQRIHIRGVATFGLSECKELVNAEGSGVLDSQRIERSADVLAPASRIALSGDLRNFAGLINLERQPPSDDPFHRVYRGQHPTRRDKVILHVYDLSASDDRDSETRARREFEVMQRWQKSPHLPNLLDSFQEAEHYPGEIFYFSLVDPAAPTVAERALDVSWDLDSRLRYAREALLALAEFHSPSDGGLPPIVHRRISPRTLRVRHNGQPLFTDFSLARLAEAQTISSSPASFSGDEPFVAPEVLQGGLAAADARSDITHAIIFDEAHRAAKLKLIPTMAKESRKFGISFVVASQEAKDFDQSLFTAIANYLTLRVSEPDAKLMAKIFAPSDKVNLYADRIKQTAKFKGWFYTDGMRTPLPLSLTSDSSR